MKKSIPWIVFGIFALYVAESALRPLRSPEGFNLADFGRLPVLLNGRVQPLDSVGRNSLLQIRSTATLPLEEKKAWQFWKHPRKLGSTEWLLEVFSKPEQADQREIFLIHNPELLGELKLTATPGSGLSYYSFQELYPKLDEIVKQEQWIKELKPENRTASQRQLIKLHNAVLIYQRLKNSLQPNTFLQSKSGGKLSVDDDLSARLARFAADLPDGIAAAQAKQQGKAFDQRALNAVLELARPYELVSRVALPLMIPPDNPGKSRDGWENVGASLLGSLASGKVKTPVSYLARMSSAFAKGKPAEFNAALHQYREWLERRGLEPEITKGNREFFFNEFQPFIKALAIYLVTFILGCLFWFRRSRVLYRSASGLVILAFALHTGGLVFRMILEGRPPVTNLYSSAVFVGWGAVLLGLGVEWFYRNGLGTVAAAFIGLITQVIAHNLALGGDTMQMMQAVLDNNFWLATHVIVITLGYSAMFVAGFVGIAYVLLGLFTRRLSNDSGKTLSQVVYGTVCFAALFSFLGTMLGGIWADQSWGRFWGWDPKENGALLIVLWTAIYLHVRWGRLASEQVLIALAVAGNIVTSFSWFGVNMLSVGLHSYGFMDAAFKWLMLFDISQLVIIGASLLPVRFWLSFRSAAPLEPGRKRGSSPRSRPAAGTVSAATEPQI